MTSVGTRGPYAFASAALLAAALACSSFDGAGDRLALEEGELQVTTTQNQPDRWWCLGEDPITRESRRSRAGMGQVALRLPMHDQFTQQPPTTPLEGRLCSNTDLGCTRPLVDWTAVPQDGRLAALVPSGFQGYAEVRGEGYPRSLFVIDTPVLRDLDLYSHALVPIEGLLGIGQVLMQPVLPDDGGLFVAAVLDCDGDAAEGVRVSLSSAGDPFVLVGGVPVAGSDVAADQGTVVFNQVRPGPLVVTVSLPDGRKVREQAVEIRGGWYGELFLRPIVYSADEMCSIGEGRLIPGRAESAGRLRPCEPRE